jgi:fatty-acyl-CoA synthase
VGQRGGLLRLRADFARPTVAELTEFLRDQIAPHKIPVFWTFVDGLPMTPTGKTQKYVLRQQAADGTLTFDEVRPPRSLSQTQTQGP